MLTALTNALMGLISKNPALLENVFEALLQLLLKELQAKAAAK